MAITDYISVFIVFLFAVAVVLLIGKYSGDTITNTMGNAINSTDSNAGSILLSWDDKVSSKFDYMFLIIFLCCIIGTMIASFFFSAHPIFMLVYFIVIMIGTGIAAILANSFEALTNTSTFAPLLASFPITSHIILNLPYYSIAIALIDMIVIFGTGYQKRQ